MPRTLESVGIFTEPMLATLRSIESGDAVGGFRVETAYLPKGVRVCVQGRTFIGTGNYFRAETVEVWDRYGWICACSLSPYQMMVPTAWRLGFRGMPWVLDQETIARPWVETYLREAVERTLKAGQSVTVERLLDAYNSGNPIDGVIPAAYIRKGLDRYAALTGTRP